MIKNPETLNADFTLRYTYDIYFTNHLFSKDNPLIKDYFEKSKKKNHTPKILFLIDQGVIDHHPHLKDHILNYFQDRKSTRLNSSHVAISYAVFCLKKKIKQ